MKPNEDINIMKYSLEKLQMQICQMVEDFENNNGMIVSKVHYKRTMTYSSDYSLLDHPVRSVKIDLTI